MTNRRGNHEGSIRKLPSGSFRVQVTINGKRISFSAPTRKEVQDWLQQINLECTEIAKFPMKDLTLEEYLDNWLLVKKTTIRHATHVQYSQIIRDYVIPFIGNVRVRELRTEQVQSLYGQLLKRHVSVYAVRKTHTVLHSALQHALRMEIIARNPVAFALQPSLPPVNITFLDESQASRFLLAIQGHRWEALFYLAITSGARQKELLGLKWTDLDWVKKTLRIERQLSRPGVGTTFSPTKTHHGRRTISLGSQTIHVLRLHYERQCTERLEADDQWQDHGLIFTTSVGTPIHPRNLLREFKTILKDAGLPLIRFHDLRHTCASLLLNDNVSPIVVARRLGHSKPSTTMDIYGHLIPDMQTEAAEKLDELITPILVEPRSIENEQKAFQRRRN